MNDPLVRQVVDLFDARLVDLRAQPQKPQRNASSTEPASGSGGPEQPEDPESGAES
jgi:hypothetical protein